MIKITLAIILLVIGAFQVSAKQDEYVRWIKFTGEIPENAILGGYGTNNNNPLYVGRAFVSTNPNHTNWDYTVDAEGYIPGAITPGVLSIDVVLFNKSYTVTKDIEILTTVKDSRSIKWERVEYFFDFPQLFDSDDYHPVRAGWEYSMGYNFTNYIGMAFTNRMHFGKIFNAAYSIIAKNSILYYADNANVSQATTYSVLIYYE